MWTEHSRNQSKIPRGCFLITLDSITESSFLFHKDVLASARTRTETVSAESANARHSRRVLHTPAQGGLLSHSLKVLPGRAGTGLKSRRGELVYASGICQLSWGTPAPHSSWLLWWTPNTLGPRHTILIVLNSDDIREGHGSLCPKSTEGSKSTVMMAKLS